MILAGDIGGTNTRLSLFDTNLKPLKGSLIKYPSTQHKSLEDILDLYLAEVPKAAKLTKKLKLKHAGFGVAGPVQNGKVKTTNLPWTLDAKKLAKKLGVKAVALHNDLYATAAGIEVLPKSAFAVLRKGTPVKPGGTRAVIAPGTGLGHASLIWTGGGAGGKGGGGGGGHLINPAECGHADFAATNELEDRLRAYIAAKDDTSRGFFKRCSYENILSGPGLRNIYDFLVDSEKYPAHDLVTQAEPKDKPGIISQCGLAESNPTCTKALEIFVSVFGRQAGNFALSVLAQDGVYLGGGIPPKILDALKKPAFLAAFDDKGSQAWVKNLTIQVITNDLCALYGAANSARRA